MTLRSVQYDFQQCNMLYIALGNNVATGYKYIYATVLVCPPHLIFYNSLLCHLVYTYIYIYIDSKLAYAN